MAKVVICLPIDGILKQWGAKLAELGEKKARIVMARALNYEGRRAYTKTLRSLTRTTSIEYGEVLRRTMFIHASPVGSGDISARVRTRGDEMPVKAFGPAQNRKGVKVKMWGRSQTLKGAFIGPNCHVYKRLGTSRLPIKKLWGPNLGRELVKEYNANFMMAIGTKVQARVEKEIAAVMRGY